MSQLLDHPVPTLPPPPSRKGMGAKRRRLTRTSGRIAAIVIGVIVVASVWLFYFSSVFALESLVVDGVRTIPPSVVGSKADLGAGTPLAHINPEEVEARVMTIPAVMSVEVTRRWPNTVVIRVTERQRAGYVKTIVQQAPAEATTDENGNPVDPAAVQTDENGNPIVPPAGTGGTEEVKYDVLDATGYAFESFETLDEVPEGLPQIKAPESNARDAAAEVGGALPPDLQEQIVDISAETPDDIRLMTDGEVRVLWGKSEQNELKARILAALLKKTDDYWIDLRYPQAPTSAAASPQPAPPPTPNPTASATDSSGNPTASPSAGVSGESTGQPIPEASGIEPSSNIPDIP